MEHRVLHAAAWPARGYPSVAVEWRSFPLKLRSAFGTSHSSTTMRTNALVKVTVGDLSAYGEVGLPPKKAHVYISDLEDVCAFAEAMAAALDVLFGDEEQLACARSYDPFSSLAPRFFAALRGSAAEGKEGQTGQTLRALLHALDGVAASAPASWRAPMNGLDCACLSLWASSRQEPLFRLIGYAEAACRPSFYTAALNADRQQFSDSLQYGLQYTPHIKIKLDADVAKGIEVLEEVSGRVAKESGREKPMLVVDANASWTPAIAMEFLPVFQKHAPRFYALEQPFGVDVGQDGEAWTAVAAAYGQAGIQVVADESMCVSGDVARLEKVASGVNIKLDKAGGIRSALRCVAEAEARGMHVWIGIMVSSVLASSTAAQLLSCSTVGGDVDGGLLIDPAYQSRLVAGGFAWGQGAAHGDVQWPAGTVGVACEVLDYPVLPRNIYF